MMLTRRSAPRFGVNHIHCLQGKITMNYQQNFIVITGGPGGGKTTLVETLAASGFLAVEEAGRRIIQEQRSCGGNATHDGDRIAFRRLMFEDALQTYQRMTDFTGPVFFDRGLPDLIGYSRLIGAPVPSWLQQAVENYRYNETVFIAPAWQEIFRQDDERQQDFAEAAATCEAMRAAYEETGYRLAELPRSTIDERVAFMLERIQDAGGFTAQSGRTPNSIPKTSGPSA